MKRLYSILALSLAVFTVTAQQSLLTNNTPSTLMPFSASELSNSHNPEEALIERGAEFFCEDFSNGFSGNNPFGSWSHSDSGSNSIWMMADADSPDGEWSVGAEPLASPTAANGWVIFDADRYNSQLGQGNYEDVVGYLYSPFMNMSDLGTVIVDYYQVFRYCCFPGSPLTLEVSADGGNQWISFPAHGSFIQSANTASANPLHTTVDISCIAAGESSVQIRFAYNSESLSGYSHYYWGLDDICIYENGAANDLEVVQVTNGDVFNWWEYESTPFEQAITAADGGLIIGSMFRNNGSSDQTGVQLTVQVLDENMSVLNTTSSATFNMPSMANSLVCPAPVSDTIYIATGWVPDAIGTYYVRTTISSNQNDEVIGNNTMQKAIRYTFDQYGHDDQEILDVQLTPRQNDEGGALYDPTGYASRFHCPNPGTSAHGVQFVPGADSEAGCVFYAILYEGVGDGIEMFDANSASIVAYSQWVYDDAWDNTEVYLPFDFPYLLDEDRVYHAGILEDVGSNYQITVLANGNHDTDNSSLQYQQAGDGSFIWFGNQTATPSTRLITSDGDCTFNGINVFTEGCGESLTDVMFFEFDYEGGCLVSEICYESTFSEAEGCFSMIDNNLGSGDIWGINSLEVGVWNFYYTLSDGSTSPMGSLTINSCVQVLGCTNPFATNYNPNADTEDGSCTYDETICDCAGTEHTIGVVAWVGDGFPDNNAYQWDGQDVDFECATWGYDCGDIDGTPSDDPYNVCGGSLPPNNGCAPIETPGCTDLGACNYNIFATVDDGSCEYQSCAGCTNPNACNYDFTATLEDGTCEFSSCAGCTNPAACNYDDDAVLEDGSCEFVTCAGCTDNEACNYDNTASIDNGSCDYSCYGCTDSEALNYDPNATIDDGTCSFNEVDGCTDDQACNYDPFATNDDGSCEYLTCAGCTNFLACNYDLNATIDDGSCDFSCYGCTDSDALNYDPNATIDDGTCSYEVVDGCTDDEACNYDPFATDDDGSCEYVSCAGCTDPLADNYDSSATIDDGSCIYGGIEGCTDSTALNYDPSATVDDGSCIFNCDFPSIAYTPFCEDDEPDGYYIEMDISDLGNGAPYLVTNSANSDEFPISFNGTIEIGPFDNDVEVVILVSSTVLDGCLVSSPPLVNDCEVGVEELNASSFAIFPNPNDGQFAIQTSNFEGKATLEVLDATGKLVASQEFIVKSNQVQTMDLNNLANGMYVVRLRSNETVAVDQLIIRH